MPSHYLDWFDRMNAWSDSPMGRSAKRIVRALSLCSAVFVVFLLILMLTGHLTINPD